MPSERQRGRAEAAIRARSGTGVELTAEEVAGIVFAGENQDASTDWLTPGNERMVTLRPADVMRYGLQERMRAGLEQANREALRAEARAVAASPPADLADPTAQEGRTDDGWRWSMVHDEAADEWMVAVDNKPAVEAAAADAGPGTTGPGERRFPELQRVVLPLDVMEAVVRGAGR